MNLKNQKRLASEIMGVGVYRVLIPAESAEQVSEALTREDVRILIHKGAIKKKPLKNSSKSRVRARSMQKKKGRQKGYGKRKGKHTARLPRKKVWIKKIRAIRDEIRKLMGEGKIENYRKIYRQAKGNLFHSRRHLREHIERSKT
ncbi:MAG: 50S ribosomal protein L19e [Candidatus Altiarchaeota archaeon]